MLPTAICCVLLCLVDGRIGFCCVLLINSDQLYLTEFS